MNNIIKIIYIKTIQASMFFTKFFKLYQKHDSFQLIPSTVMLK